MAALDPALAWSLRGAGALLLLSSAADKLREPRRFRDAVRAYALLPGPLVGAAALAFTLVELAAGLALLWPAGARLAALAGVGLLGVYSLAIAVNLLRGRRDLDCGCGGPAGRQPLGGGLLLRNAALMLGFGVLTLPPAPRGLVWLDALSIAGGVLALALLYAAVDLALARFAIARLPDDEDDAWSMP